MGAPTKVQLIDRQNSQQWYVNFPAANTLLLLAAVLTFGPTGSPHTLPPPAWRRHEHPQRAATVQLINHLRWEL